MCGLLLLVAACAQEESNPVDLGAVVVVDEGRLLVEWDGTPMRSVYVHEIEEALGGRGTRVWDVTWFGPEPVHSASSCGGEIVPPIEIGTLPEGLHSDEDWEPIEVGRRYQLNLQGCDGDGAGLHQHRRFSVNTDGTVLMDPRAP